MSKRSRRRNKHKAPLEWIKRAGTSAPSLPPAMQVAHEILNSDPDFIHDMSDAERVHVTSMQDASRASSASLHRPEHDPIMTSLGPVLPSSRLAMNPDKSHSLGVRDNLRKGDIAKRLLGTLGDKMVEAADRVMPEGDWPLIDKVHNATFGDSVPMQYVEDKYAFRGLLRKAHCFTLDAPTSSLVSDFSLAVVQDIDAARRLAIPPFPVTWFDLDNKARLARIQELGVPLTTTAKREDVIPRVGWLVHPAHDLHADGHYLTYCAELEQGVFVAPLSYFWHTAESDGDAPRDFDKHDHDVIERLSFGVKDSGVSLSDAFPAVTPFNLGYRDEHKINPRKMYGLMNELSGELRHLFGLLIALGAGQLGAAADTSKVQAPPRSRPFEQKGKTLLPLEHKVLTITLSKRTSAKVVTAKAIFHARKRWHEVRGHWRTLKNEDGTVRKRVPVKPHERGDKHLGVIEKTYLVHK